MKTYTYFLLALALYVGIWIITAPAFVSAKNDIAVLVGYLLMAISLPVFVWIGKKIWSDQKANINKLKELLK